MKAWLGRGQLQEQEQQIEPHEQCMNQHHLQYCRA
jgi:hypothetical protein